MAGKNLPAERPACAKVLWLEGAWLIGNRDQWRPGGLAERVKERIVRGVQKEKGASPTGHASPASRICIDLKLGKPPKCFDQRGDTHRFASWKDDTGCFAENS